MSVWVGVVLLVALLIKVAYDERAYRRSLDSRRADFYASCDERAARSALGYPVVNQARPHSVGTRGRAHERKFDGSQDTAS